VRTPWERVGERNLDERGEKGERLDRKVGLRRERVREERGKEKDNMLRREILSHSVSLASSGRFPSQAVCGFPAVWVVCEDVHCGVCLVAGGCLSMVRGGGVFCAVSGGLRLGVALVDVRLDVVPLPPRSLCFLADCGGLLVGWVSCWT
jgi:hypothetical protein